MILAYQSLLLTGTKLCFDIKPQENITIPVDDSITNCSSCAVVWTLLYFDCFNHPLKRDEIHSFCQAKLSTEQIDRSIDNLVQSGEIVVSKAGSYFSLGLSEHAIQRRQDAEARFRDKLSDAKAMSRIVASFPFVQSICLSGSMSKGVFYAGSDIDYFIITKDKKLWVTRLLLILYKKVVLGKQREDFCPNYFIEEKHPEIEEKNIYSATELITLLPMYDYCRYKSLLGHNSWINTYYPNATLRPDTTVTPAYPKTKRILEKLCSNRLFDFLGRQFMKMVWKKYNRTSHSPYSPEELKVMYKIKSHVSKIHNSGHQKKLTDKLAQKRNQLGPCKHTQSL